MTRLRILRLAREVRFALTGDGERGAVGNNFAGIPAPAGAAPFYRVTAELVGPVDRRIDCVAGLTHIDAVVRDEMPRAIRGCLASGREQPGDWLAAAWMPIAARLAAGSPTRLDALTLRWTPFHTVTYRGDSAMSIKGRGKRRSQPKRPPVYLTEQFEFSAAHRLWSAQLSDAENRRQFGKCANDAGHGHNYVVEVTVACAPGQTPLATLERVVKSEVLDRLDHRNLSVDCAEFGALNPTVENICRVIFETLIAPKALGDALAAVRVYETPKTWAECRR